MIQTIFESNEQLIEVITEYIDAQYGKRYTNQIVAHDCVQLIKKKPKVGSTYTLPKVLCEYVDRNHYQYYLLIMTHCALTQDLVSKDWASRLITYYTKFGLSFVLKEADQAVKQLFDPTVTKITIFNSLRDALEPEGIEGLKAYLQVLRYPKRFCPSTLQLPSLSAWEERNRTRGDWCVNNPYKGYYPGRLNAITKEIVLLAREEMEKVVSPIHDEWRRFFDGLKTGDWSSAEPKIPQNATYERSDCKAKKLVDICESMPQAFEDYPVLTYGSKPYLGRKIGYQVKVYQVPDNSELNFSCPIHGHDVTSTDLEDNAKFLEFLRNSEYSGGSIDGRIVIQSKLPKFACQRSYHYCINGRSYELREEDVVRLGLPKHWVKPIEEKIFLTIGEAVRYAIKVDKSNYIWIKPKEIQVARLSEVPKDWKDSRVIATAPSGRYAVQSVMVGLFQQADDLIGTGRYLLRKRRMISDYISVRKKEMGEELFSESLSRTDNDLRSNRNFIDVESLTTSLSCAMKSRTNEFNRLLCYIGAREGTFATTDLSAASDTIWWWLVPLIYPSDMADDILNVVPRFYTLGKGEVHPMQMLATMGEGITWPLQKHLFYCIQKACVKYLCTTSFGGLRQGEPIYAKDDRADLCIAHGDDMICPTEVAPFLWDVLESLGFTVNRSKSYADQATFQWGNRSFRFRESCGCDFAADVSSTDVNHSVFEVTSKYWPRQEIKLTAEHDTRDPDGNSISFLIDLQHHFFAKGWVTANDFLVREIGNYHLTDQAYPGTAGLNIWARKPVPQITFEEPSDHNPTGIRHVVFEEVVQKEHQRNSTLDAVAEQFMLNKFLLEGPLYKDELSELLRTSERRNPDDVLMSGYDLLLRRQTREE